ncbi:MAG: MucB/RseB C-terminal domain-containing protein [Pseudomonadota bacterium]
MIAHSRLIFGILAGLTLLSGSARAQSEPVPLLQQINDAMQTLDYEGTLVRSMDGRLYTLHVAHLNNDGVSMEKLVSMDGEQREIVRVGNELVCLYPNRQLKFIDKTAGASNAFTRLPVVAENVGRFYELVSLGTDRVAGREAKRFFIRPKDAFRYGHSLWVDAETLLPLRMQLLNGKRVVEEVRFTDVQIGVEIPKSALISDIDDSEFQVIHASPSELADKYSESSVQRAANTLSASPGEVVVEGDSTSGFTLRGPRGEMVQVNGRTVRRFEYSDGIATVSVFVAAGSSGTSGKHGKMGATHSYQRSVGNQTMTLVGEVPLNTLRMLAEQADQQITALDTPEPVATE